MMRAGLIVFVILMAQVPPAVALQLDKDECAKLKTEQTQLEGSGVRGTMIKGPEWAKANLPPDKLEQIKRLIELDEQLLFRCGGRPLVVMPSDPDADPAARGADPDAPQPEPAVMAPKAPAPAPPAGKKSASPVQKAAAPPAPAAVAKESAKPGASSATRPAPPPIKGTAEGSTAKASKEEKAAKAKKKADDAYRPPSSDWSNNPFGEGSSPPAKN